MHRVVSFQVVMIIPDLVRRTLPVQKGDKGRLQLLRPLAQQHSENTSFLVVTSQRQDLWWMDRRKEAKAI
jgi:hypothetical protein